MRNRALFWSGLMGVFGPVLVATLLVAGCQTMTSESVEDGAWVDRETYQRTFEVQVAAGRYPAEVEGRLSKGDPQFRATFEPFPPGEFKFHSRHGIFEATFRAQDQELATEGFRRAWVQDYVDASGQRRFQATWVKTAAD